VTEPESATKDLWDAGGGELPPTLFPPVTAAPEAAPGPSRSSDR
jgi:hypothetical protein